MDAAASNGGLLYHEVQEGKLCAVHCVNTALQGPFFSEFDLAALAADLDQRERLVMLEGSQSPGAANAAAGDFLTKGSHNISLGVISPSKSVQAFQAPCRFNPVVFHGLGWFD